MAHKLAGWLHKPYLWGSPTLQGGGQNHQGPKGGPGGYITPTALGVPNASEHGTKLEVAHKWAGWLHTPCRPRVPNASQHQQWPTGGPDGYIYTTCHLGGPQRFGAG